MKSQISRRSPWKMGTALLVALSAVAVLALTVLPSAAQDVQDTGDVPPPISSVELTARSRFTDAVDMRIRLKPEGRRRQTLNIGDPSRVAMAEITVQPGARFPWHTHPGPVIATVKQGTLVYIYRDDCRERTYGEGTAFIDPGYGNIHSAYNPTDEPAIVLATFLDAPEDGPLTVPTGTEPPTSCWPKGR